MSTQSICTIPRVFMGPGDSSDRLRGLLGILGRTAEDTEESRQLQTQIQLQGVLNLCSRAIPAYRERLGKVPSEMSWDDFRRLPILTRGDLQDQGDSLNHPNPPPPFAPTSSSTTSGSTGKPIVTQGHQVASLMSRALQLRFQRWHGFDFSATCAFITSPYPPGQADPPDGALGSAWAAPLGSGASRVTNLMSDPSAQLDFLVKHPPRYLATYPSNLQALVKNSLERGIRPRSLEAVVLSSEPLSDDLVELVRESWGVRALGTYSASEVGLIAAAIPNEPGYYIQSESLFVEVLRDDDTPCGPGEVGRIVVTTLQEFLRPLIRYEMGDYGELAPSNPNDPVRLPRLRRIVGRQRTMIRLPDGRRIWPHFEFAPLVKLGGIRQWQLVQRKDLSILVRVVPMETLSHEMAQAVETVVQEGLPGVHVAVEAVDSIERTARGKYLELISELEE